MKICVHVAQTSDLGGVKVELAQATHHSPQRGDKRRQKGGGAERVLLHFDVTDAVCGGCPKVRVTKSYIKLLGKLEGFG